MNHSLRNLHSIDKNAFQAALINWFKKEKRNLPWRQDQDPYKIWVSEIMLQQTRVETVIPYFNRFIEQFPNIRALSDAEEDKVLKAWEGLGYYSRARNLQSAVREVREKYGGQVPKTREEILSLKGVGPYTAGAILSIAYGIPEPAVDGNVMRVLSRILSIWEDVAKSSTRTIFETAVRELISHEDPSYFNQALMELGAIICTPQSPSCLLCPVREFCNALEEGTENELPVKTKGKNRRSVQLAAIIIQNERGNTVIHKRPPKGLLANLWEFPNIEISYPLLASKKLIEEKMSSEYKIDVEIGKMIEKIEHIFSHLTWNIDVYEGRLISPLHESNTLKLVSKEEIKEYPFPVSHQKMLKYLHSTYKNRSN